MVEPAVKGLKVLHYQNVKLNKNENINSNQFAQSGYNNNNKKDKLHYLIKLQEDNDLQDTLTHTDTFTHRI